MVTLADKPWQDRLPFEKPPKKTGDSVMLGDNYFRATSVRHRSERTIELAINPTDAEQEAALSSLRPTRYGGTADLAFAVNNDAHSVRVEQVETETVAKSGTSS